VEEAASRVRREVDPDANPDINIIVGATFDHSIEGRIRVSVVATGISSGLLSQEQKPEESKDNNRATDRVSAASANHNEREKPRPQERDRETGTWQGSGNVTIEPRAPKYTVNQASQKSQQRFEPQPPAKPVRPPRRPLTGKDFPELAEHEAEVKGRQNLSLKRRGGLLNWVTGRRNHADDSASRQPPAFDNRNNAHDSEGEDGVDDETRSARDNKDTSRRRSSDEPFEIPNFFKRSVN
jgi:cell division protein FtsZ